MVAREPRPGDSFAARFAASRPASDAAGLAALALRTGSAAVVEILAMAPPAPEWLLQLARVRALWPHPPGPDPDAAADICRDVMAQHGPHVFDAALGGLYAQILMSLGRRDELIGLLDTIPMDPDVRWSVETDLHDPCADDAGRSWARQFSRIFGGLEAVGVEAGAAPPFERLRSTRTKPTGGDLVSVIMPAYQPGRGILAAARSILEQSWSDLELIVVDDGSAREFGETFAAVADLDSRVRVVSGRANGGTYVARNLGLDAARGTFVTFHDADDWAHPRRIETQVRPLLDRAELLGTRSRSVRAFPDLRLTYVGYPPTRVNASSLLFRREPVLDRIGHFDEVRKSGDIEFPARLQAIAPRSLLDLEGPPLSIVQLRRGSLSRADAVPGWLHWERRAYRDRYREWHGRIREGLAHPMLPARERPFPLPAATWAPHVVESTTTDRKNMDIVYLDDWRKSRGHRYEAAAEVETLTAAGRTVAVADAEGLMPMAADREDRSWLLSRLLVGGIPFVHMDEPVDADILVVADPAVLQILPDHSGGLRAAAVVILVGRSDADHDADEVDIGYRTADCDANAERSFGVRPIWLPRTPPARRWLERNLPAARIADDDLPLAPGAPTGRTDRRFGPRPVIGHHLPDAAASWPRDGRRLLSVYPDDGSLDVRILRAGRSAASLIGADLPPPAWVAYDRLPLTAAEFLRQIDFFVYFGAAGHTDRAVRSVLEAMASGCVAILPSSFTDDFGDAAVYADEDTAVATVMGLHDDPERFLRHRHRGLEVAKVRTRDFADRITAASLEPR